MKRFIYVFILSLLIIAFSAFFINTYELQKNYFESKLIEQEKVDDQNITYDEVPSSFTPYSKVQYETALSEKRVLVLFFTSNWCKECLDQEAIISEVFSELNKEGIVGLTVHILDSETTTETDALARKFDITKESSYVLLNKDGSVAYKYVGTIDKELLKAKIIEATVR